MSRDHFNLSYGRSKPIFIKCLVSASFEVRVILYRHEKRKTKNPSAKYSRDPLNCVTGGEKRPLLYAKYASKLR
jgi:hypothetical protein